MATNISSPPEKWIWIARQDHGQQEKSGFFPSYLEIFSVSKYLYFSSTDSILSVSFLDAKRSYFDTDSKIASITFETFLENGFPANTFENSWAYPRTFCDLTDPFSPYHHYLTNIRTGLIQTSTSYNVMGSSCSCLIAVKVTMIWVKWRKLEH